MCIRDSANEYQHINGRLANFGSTGEWADVDYPNEFNQYVLGTVDSIDVGELVELLQRFDNIDPDDFDADKYNAIKAIADEAKAFVGVKGCLLYTSIWKRF